MATIVRGKLVKISLLCRIGTPKLKPKSRLLFDRLPSTGQQRGQACSSVLATTIPNTHLLSVLRLLTTREQ